MYHAPEFIEIIHFHFFKKTNDFEMHYLYLAENGRFVTVVVSHLGVCVADICPRPHRVSVDTGQASRCRLKRPVTIRSEVSQKPPFSYH